MKLPLKISGFVGSFLLSAAFSIAAMANSMQTGKLTSQPIGHYEFCLIYVDECSQLRGIDLEPVRLTKDLWSSMVNINSAINMIVEPKSDMDIYGREEVWTFPDQAGDCEDYVLLKRQMLVNEGILNSP